MEITASVFILVALATCVIPPISGQGWKYQQIGEGWQADESVDEDVSHVDYRFTGYKCEYLHVSV